MRIALFQFDPVFGAVESNLATIEQACVALKTDLLVLPELCTTGYQFMNRKEALSLAQPAEGSATARMAALASRIGGAIVFGFAERDRDQIYNSAVLVGSSGLQCLYRKIHLFGNEKECFDPGNLGFSVIEAGGVKVGMMICFDWIFPEAARTLALQGAQVIAHPSNLVMPYCPNAMVTRALENRVFTITANRIGCEERQPGDRLEFIGSSRIVAPDGRVVAEASRNARALLQTTIDPVLANNKHIINNNDLFLDRRPNFYLS